MKVSIIIPLYNKAPYVSKTLESVWAQTYTDYECIIVNDGSTDNSKAVVEEWIENINAHQSAINLPLIPFRVINQVNAGVSAARNRGIEESVGDYIAFLDADDWWKPTFLEDMINLTKQYPGAGLYACNYIYYKSSNTHVAIKNIETGYFNYPKSYLESIAMPVTSISVMIPRDVLVGDNAIVSGFPKGVKLGEDFLTWSKIAKKTKVVFLNKPLAYYNNDIPSINRATRNVYNPNEHMLWYLDEIATMESAMPNEYDWKILLIKLRLGGLQKYWLSRQYHDWAKQELTKIDWSAIEDQPWTSKYKHWYKIPTWWHIFVGIVLNQTVYFKKKCKEFFR